MKNPSNKKVWLEIAYVGDYYIKFYYTYVRIELFINLIDTISNKNSPIQLGWLTRQI